MWEGNEQEKEWLKQEVLETLLSVFINAKLHILVNKYPEGRVLEYTDHRKLESGPMNGKN